MDNIEDTIEDTAAITRHTRSLCNRSRTELKKLRLSLTQVETALWNTVGIVSSFDGNRDISEPPYDGSSSPPPRKQHQSLPSAAGARPGVKTADL